MPAVTKITASNISGGALANGQVANVVVNGQPINVKGDGPHTSHGISLHSAPMSTDESSSTVKAGGKFVIREGDLANCGHPHAAGSGNVNAG
jgi:uncharacterized Zn-binding protein involved in type VI secretion|tara:strand:+ start:37 stop:312 length:276 start_codon:yes stop_codon:yes gene_type:complete